jgi:hypothetical protein
MATDGPGFVAGLQGAVGVVSYPHRASPGRAQPRRGDGDGDGGGRSQGGSASRPYRAWGICTASTTAHWLSDMKCKAPCCKLERKKGCASRVPRTACIASTFPHVLGSACRWDGICPCKDTNTPRVLTAAPPMPATAASVAAPPQAAGARIHGVSACHITSQPKQMCTQLILQRQCTMHRPKA